MGIFSVNKEKYAALCSQMTTEQLQQEETRCIRSRYSSSWGVGVGLGAMAAHIATLPLPLYSMMKFNKATDQLAIIQAELQRRSVQARHPENKDKILGFTAGYTGQEVDEIIDFATGFEAAKDIAPPQEVGYELAKAIPSEAATKGVLKTTNRI
jgi:hypothetical protein